MLRSRAPTGQLHPTSRMKLSNLAHSLLRVLENIRYSRGLHMTIGLQFRRPLVIPLLLFWIGPSPSANAQQGAGSVPVSNAPLKTQQIVENLVRRNLERAQGLHAYVGTRIYQMKYRGFPGARTAELVVDVKYQSPGTKEFTIRSASGSALIIDKVLKKLLQAEKEASSIEAQKRTALNGDNYNFAQVGYENTRSRLMYVLTVEPKRNDKLLYRGRIWVDARDFAVTRLEAELAKNPSFWTKNSEIEQVYMKVGEFWLPVRNHSISEIRLGGTADLTIDYTGYQILRAEQVNNTVDSAQTAGTIAAQP